MESKFGKPILALTPTILPRIARIFRSEDKGEGGKTIGRWGVFTDGSKGNTSPAPLNRLLHSLLAFSALYKLKTCQIFAPNLATLHAVPVSFMVPKFSLKFATQSSEFECFGKMHLEHIIP